MKSSGVEVDVISHKRQRYAVWFGGSLMASLVRLFFHSKLTAFDLLMLQSPSPSSTVSVTRRHSMTKSGQASADVTKFLEAQPRSSDMEQFYSCNYHIPRNEKSNGQQMSTPLENRSRE